MAIDLDIQDPTLNMNDMERMMETCKVTRLHSAARDFHEDDVAFQRSLRGTPHLGRASTSDMARHSTSACKHIAIFLSESRSITG